MKQNCLTRALDQWDENREEFRLWYNSDHVISLQKEYDGGILEGHLSYIPLSPFFSFEHLVCSFKLPRKYRILLREYLNFDVKK